MELRQCRSTNRRHKKAHVYYKYVQQLTTNLSYNCNLISKQKIGKPNIYFVSQWGSFYFRVRNWIEFCESRFLYTIYWPATADIEWDLSRQNSDEMLDVTILAEELRCGSYDGQNTTRILNLIYLFIHLFTMVWFIPYMQPRACHTRFFWSTDSLYVQHITNTPENLYLDDPKGEGTTLFLIERPVLNHACYILSDRRRKVGP